MEPTDLIGHTLPGGFRVVRHLRRVVAGGPSLADLTGVSFIKRRNEEIIPIELNMERVKRSRELGVLRLRQPLNSFRDHSGQFGIYQRGAKLPYLESLGPLIKPTRLDRLHELKRREDELVSPREQPPHEPPPPTR